MCMKACSGKLKHIYVCKWGFIYIIFYIFRAIQLDWNLCCIDTDLGMSGKFLKKILSSSLLCFCQSNDFDAISSFFSNYPHKLKYWITHVVRVRVQKLWKLMATPSSLQKKRKSKKQGRAISESPSIARVKGIFTASINTRGQLLWARCLTTFTTQVLRSGSPILSILNC